MIELAGTNLPGNTPLNFRLECSTCKRTVDEDLMGWYEGNDICDECGDRMTARWYNASRAEILEAAQLRGRKVIGSEFTLHDQDKLVIVEDDLGDVVFCSFNGLGLLSGHALPKTATTDYLPESIRPVYRDLHREAVKSLEPREYEFDHDGRRWTGECFPFVADEELFTLSVLS